MQRKTEYKSIATKVPIKEYLEIGKYCEMKGVSSSSLIRDLLLSEIKVSVPHNVAGRNHFEYNKDRDTFSWFVLLDNGDKIEVLRNVSPAYVTDLQKIIASALNRRSNVILEQKHDSVAIPGRLMKVKR